MSRQIQGKPFAPKAALAQLDALFDISSFDLPVSTTGKWHKIPTPEKRLRLQIIDLIEQFPIDPGSFEAWRARHTWQETHRLLKSYQDAMTIIAYPIKPLEITDLV